jgi:hypothetical protein
VLERDFARHHDTGHYADELRVPQSGLSRALAQVTGRSRPPSNRSRPRTE